MLDTLATAVKKLRQLRLMVIFVIVLSCLNVFGLFILTGNQTQIYRTTKHTAETVEAIKDRCSIGENK
jgi:hypothetical protein